MKNLIILLWLILFVWFMMNQQDEYVTIKDDGCAVITSKDELGNWFSIERCPPEQPTNQNKSNNVDYILYPTKEA